MTVEKVRVVVSSLMVLTFMCLGIGKVVELLFGHGLWQWAVSLGVSTYYGWVLGGLTAREVAHAFSENAG